MKDRFEDYELKGNPVESVPTIGNLEYDNLGECVDSKIREEFGDSWIISQSNYESGKYLGYSTIPAILKVNQILMEETNRRMSVLDPFEAIPYWFAIPELRSTNACLNGIVVYGSEYYGKDKQRERILDIINKPEAKAPFVVSGLGVKKKDDEVGFTFEERDDIKVREIPILRNINWHSHRVAYDLSTGNIIEIRESPVTLDHYVFDFMDLVGRLRPFHRVKEKLEISQPNFYSMHGTKEGITRIHVIKYPKKEDKEREASVNINLPEYLKQKYIETGEFR